MCDERAGGQILILVEGLKCHLAILVFCCYMAPNDVSLGSVPVLLTQRCIRCMLVAATPAYHDASLLLSKTNLLPWYMLLSCASPPWNLKAQFKESPLSDELLCRQNSEIWKRKSVVTRSPGVAQPALGRMPAIGAYSMPRKMSVPKRAFPRDV